MRKKLNSLGKTISSKSIKLEWNSLLTLGIITFLALFVRLYNINRHSIWFDEYVVVGNARISSLKEYFYLLFTNSPDYGVSPGASVLFYFLINWFPDWDVIWRLLPISFGVSSIIIFYFFIKNSCGENIAFLASVLFSLSPFNIWFHQEIKCYAFLQFFSLISFISFYKYLFLMGGKNNNRYWLIVNGIFNSIIPWFHLTYVTVPVVQFITALVLNYKKKIRKVILWILANGIAILPWIIWYRYVHPYFYNLMDFESNGDTLKEAFLTFFGSDCVRLSSNLLPEWKINLLQYSGLTKILLGILPFWDFIIISFIMLSLCIYFFGRCFLPSNLSSHQEVIKYFASVILISAGIFFILGIFLKSSAFSQLYFFYYLPMLYLVEAYALNSISMKKLIKVGRWILIVILLIAYSNQTFSMVYFINRTNYKEAVKFLETNAGVNDIVFGQRFISFWDICKFYKKRHDLRHRSYYSLEGLLSEVDRALNEEDILRLWIIVEPLTLYILYKEDVINLITQKLLSIGYDVNWKSFLGHYNLYLGMVERRKGNSSKENSHYELYQEQLKLLMVDNSNLNILSFIKNKLVPPNRVYPPDYDYEDLLTELNLFCDNMAENNRRIGILRKYISYWPLLSYINLFTICELIKNGELDIAQAICDYILQENPKYYAVTILSAIISYLKFEHIQNNQFLTQSFTESILFRNFYGPILADIIDSEKTTFIPICRRLQRINSQGLWLLGDAFSSICDIKFKRSKDIF